MSECVFLLFLKLYNAFELSFVSSSEGRRERTNITTFVFEWKPGKCHSANVVEQSQVDIWTKGTLHLIVKKRKKSYPSKQATTKYLDGCFVLSEKELYSMGLRIGEDNLNCFISCVVEYEEDID